MSAIISEGASTSAPNAASAPPTPAPQGTTPQIGLNIGNTSTAFIHYNLERVDYTISDGEIAQLEKCNDNIWKDTFLACTGIGVPCIINAINLAIKPGEFKSTIDFILNLCIGLVCVLGGIVSFIAWKNTKSGASTIIAQIRAKPRVRVSPLG